MERRETVPARFLNWTLALLVAISLTLVPGLGALAQSAASPTPAATATPEPTIWFFLGPKGKSNGDYFDITLAAGKSATLTVTAGNGSAIPVKAVIYAADVYSAENGGFAMKDSQSKPTGPTTWLDFPAETHDFAPSQGIDKTFTVTVPPGTAPGQYIAGLAIETADSRAIAGGQTLRQKIRLATAVLITVPGPVTPRFAASDLAIVVSAQGATLSGTIKNTGNIKVRPQGDITLTDASGKTAATVPIKMGSVYAGQSTTFAINLTAPLPEGTYRANGVLKDPDTGATATIKDASVTAAPPAAPSPLSISEVTLAPQPSLAKIVFVQVKATVKNTGQPVANGQLTLQVYRDGKLVDTHALATSLTLVTGDTVVDQPYIPASGAWQPGTYSFALVLDQADPSTGAATTIGTFTVGQTIVVTSP